MKKIILLAALALIFNSCTKPEKGETGAPGTPGNANVHSYLLNVNNWSYDNTNKYWYVTATSTALTADIVNYGQVNVFMGSSSVWTQLPITTYPASTYSETVYFVYTLNTITFYVQDSDLTQPANPGAITFKMVVTSSSNHMQRIKEDLF